MLSSAIENLEACDKTEDEMYFTDRTHNQLRDSLNQIRSNDDVTHSKYDVIIRSKNAMLEEKEAKLLESKLEIASLQHQINELQAMTASNFSFEENEQKKEEGKNFKEILQRTEFEMRNLELNFEEEKKYFKFENNRLNKLCKMQEAKLEDARLELLKSTEKVSKYRKRIECLEEYLGEIPTIEERDKMKKEINDLTRERELMIKEIVDLKNQIQNFVKKNEEDKKSIKNLQFLIKQEEIKQSELKLLQEPLTQIEREQLQKLELKNEQMKIKILEVVKKMKRDEKSFKEQMNFVKLELEDSKEENSNFKSHFEANKEKIQKLNKAIASMTSRNQNLLEENLTLQEKIKSSIATSEKAVMTSRVSAQLQEEIRQSVSDLHNVAEMFLNMVSDESKLEVSQLLGLSRKLSETTTEETEDLNEKLKEMKEVREDIEKLQHLISNRYANHIGDTCITQ